MFSTHLTQSVSRGQQREPLQPEVNTARWDVLQIEPLFTKTELSLNTHSSHLVDFVEPRQNGRKGDQGRSHGAMWGLHCHMLKGKLQPYSNIFLSEIITIIAAFLCLLWYNTESKISKSSKTRITTHVIHNSGLLYNIKIHLDPKKRDRKRETERINEAMNQRDYGV